VTWKWENIRLYIAYVVILKLWFFLRCGRLSIFCCWNLRLQFWNEHITHITLVIRCRNACLNGYLRIHIVRPLYKVQPQHSHRLSAAARISSSTIRWWAGRQVSRREVRCAQARASRKAVTVHYRLIGILSMFYSRRMYARSSRCRFCYKVRFSSRSAMQAGQSHLSRQGKLVCNTTNGTGSSASVPFALVRRPYDHDPFSLFLWVSRLKSMLVAIMAHSR